MCCEPEKASSRVTSTSVSILAMGGRPAPKPSKFPKRKPPSRSSKPPKPADVVVRWVPAPYWDSISSARRQLSPYLS